MTEHMGVPTCEQCGTPLPANGNCPCRFKVGDVLGLSRRGFFGATSAALVAMLAPRRAYSFLTANPLAPAPRMLGTLLVSMQIVFTWGSEDELRASVRQSVDRYIQRREVKK